MLNQLKKNVSRKNILAYIVFGAIILVFVFFGFATTDNTVGYAARVNNELISVRDFQREVENMSQYKFIFGGDGEDADKRLKNNAINQLIKFELISQSALKTGFRISNEELVDQIITDPVFMEDGKFQRSRYDRLLEANGFTPSIHETRVKKQLLNQKVMNTFQNSFLISNLEVEKNKQLKSIQTNIEFLKLDLESLKNTKLTKEEFSKTVTEIKTLYGTDKTQAINKITQLGVKWEETGFFALDADSIPKLGNQTTLFEKLVSLKNKNDLADSMVDLYDSHYVLRLKDKKVEASKGEDANATKQQIVSSRMYEVYNKWVMSLNDTNKVSISPAVSGMIN